MSIDLTTNFGGLRLCSPIVVGSCPLTANEQTRIAIMSAGAGAMVLPSLFQEQVLLWNRQNADEFTESEKALLDRAKEVPQESAIESAEAYLALVNRASSQSNIPIIASLNGESGGNWLDFAAELQEAGAAAIELSINHPPPQAYSDPREVEDATANLVAQIDQAITIPLFLKLGRNYTSLSHLSHRLLSGTQGLILFGRSPDTDICLDSFKLKTVWGLTESGSILQSLGMIMRVHGFCPAMSLAASGGISSSSDVIRALLAGADVAMVTSAVYREGPSVIRTLVDGLRMFMEQHHLKSIEELQTRRPIEFDSDEERREYVRTLSQRIDVSESHLKAPKMAGDKWGHPTSKPGENLA